jgi:hypothetical protein
MTEAWSRVSRRRLCPVCGKADWCTIASDGAVHCMRVASPQPMRSGGWLHVDAVFTPPPPTWQERAEAPTIDVVGLLAEWTAATTWEQLHGLADDLCLTADSLRRLGACWSPRSRAWAFPMRNGKGEPIGIRLRSDDGHKWAVKGSRSGLFIPSSRPGGMLLICEGPTSCAALLDLGFDAIGRPDCQGGGAFLQELLRQERRDVVVFGDHDTDKQRPDGTTFRPGEMGAEALANQIAGQCRTLRVVIPPRHKDPRDWKRAGATADVVRSVIAATRYWRAK